jgi:hypothetical protein
VAEYIAPIIASVTSILQKYTPDLLAAVNQPQFAEWGIMYTGVVYNFPKCWVIPKKTKVDDGGNLAKEAHLISLKFAITGPEPDIVAVAAMAYMKAVSDAIANATGADWSPIVPFRTLVFDHDYGPMYKANEVMLALPEAQMEVDLEEPWTLTQ